MTQPSSPIANSRELTLPQDATSWVEVSQSAIAHNIKQLNHAGASSGGQPKLCVMVKGNGYGHGLLTAATCFRAAGVAWLGVHDLSEIKILRGAGFTLPLYCVGYLRPDQVADAIALQARFVCYDAEVVRAASLAAVAQDQPARLHVKIETGNNRQGLRHDEAVAFTGWAAAQPGVHIEGLCTHFADIEDTTDHGFARSQLQRFRQTEQAIRDALQLPARGSPEDQLLAHCSNTAAILLWPEVCGQLARCGIGAYGLWPSKETYLSVRELGKEPLVLHPAMAWKTVIAQVRAVPTGEYVGYGRTWRAVRPSRVAILPVGYYDGYDRGLSNIGQVLIDGWRAPVIGRVAMNMVAVDVTDRPRAEVGTTVTLLGSAQDENGNSESVRAEDLAAWLGTIHYEVTTRIAAHVPRVIVP